MNWLARLKKEKAPDTPAREPRQPPQGEERTGFLGSLAYSPASFQKIKGIKAAENDTPTADPDRWCWPHSSAMNTGEIELFNRRAALFVRRGAEEDQAERLADALVQRDREDDDRHACLECRHLQGNAPWRCGNWHAAGVAVHPGDTGLARDLATTMQRCPGFEVASLPATAPPFVVAPVPAEPPLAKAQATGPDCSPDAPWRGLDRAYLAHHAHCTACLCAGRGYGKRCDVGAGMWTAYSSASI